MSGDLRLEPIGVARTPYETPDDAPHQGFVDDEEATIQVYEPYRSALDGLDSVRQVTVLYWAHMVDRPWEPGRSGDGAFARRGPNRPNPINVGTGLLLGVADLEIRMTGLDAVNGSPVIDIKPSLRAER